MSAKFLLIDYENIQKEKLADVPEDLHIKVFVGHSQKSIPVELVQQTQPRGSTIEWIKIEGQGKNALDFHIAYYIGKLQTEHQAASFAILSKDKGFDPLVVHINKLKGNCRRVNSLFELRWVTDNAFKNQIIEKTLDNLQKSTRPKNRNALKKHIAHNPNMDLSDSDLDKIIHCLFTKGFVAETDGKLSYSLSLT